MASWPFGKQAFSNKSDKHYESTKSSNNINGSSWKSPKGIAAWQQEKAPVLKSSAPSFNKGIAGRFDEMVRL